MNMLRPGSSSPARRAITLLLCALLAFPPAGASAQPVAAGTTNTQVLPNPSGNNVPSVNIAAPNAAGLSHNKYQAFNVGTQGLVLNNATAVQRSTLAGMMQGNPNLGAGPGASVILNEVTGPNRSMLQGYIEVHGRPAELVIANPYGITCSGCGFLNTPRATLSTGVPEISTYGSLVRLRVNGGDILINGQGLDATAPNYFDIVSRQVRLEGPVYAKDLVVSAGSHAFDYANRSASVSRPGTYTGLAIDSSTLGGMYADRIRLIANDAGVGVRLLGDVAASVDDIALTVAGRLELANRSYAARDFTVLSNGTGADAITLAAGAQVHAAGNTQLVTGGGILLGAGDVGAAGTLSLSGASLSDTGGGVRYALGGGITASAVGAADLTGGVWDAAAGLSLTAATANLGATTLVTRGATDSLAINATGPLTLAGATLQSAGDVQLVSGAASTIEAGAQVFAQRDATLQFSGAFTNAGTVAAGRNLSVLDTAGPANSITNQGTGTLSASGILAIGSVGSTATVTNAATAALLADTQLNVQAGQLTNQGTLYSAGGLQVDAIRIDNAAGALLRGDGAANLNATRAPGASGLANVVANEGGLQGGTLAIQATDRIDLGGAASQVYTTGNLSLQAPQLNIGAGTVYATGNLTATTTSLTDTGGAGALRAAGGNMTLDVTNGLALAAGQQYDARGTLTIRAASLDVAASVGAVTTTISAGTALDITTTGNVTLGNGTVAGTLVSDGNVLLNANDIRVRGGASVQSIGYTSARFNNLSVDAGGAVLANTGIDLRARDAGAATLGVLGTISAGSTLTVRGRFFGERNIDATVGNGGILAGGSLDFYLNRLSIAGASGTSHGLVQGGAGTGAVNVNQLDIQTQFSEFYASDWGGTTTITVNGAFTNPGRVYGQGNVVLNADSVTNQSTGLLGSTASSLSVNATGNIDNAGQVYAYGNLGLITGSSGLLNNRPGADISTGGGGTARLGLCDTCSVASAANTVKNEGGMHFGWDAGIFAHTFTNNIPLGAVSSYVDSGQGGRAYLGDSGRYADEGAAMGWDHSHYVGLYSAAFAGGGDHDARNNYMGGGVNYYHVRGRGYKLLRDFRDRVVYQEQFANPGAAVPVIDAANSLTISTFTGENKGGSISGFNVFLNNLVPTRLGSSFTNEAPTLYTTIYDKTGRRVYDCFGTGDAACVLGNIAITDQGDEFLGWSNGAPIPSWGVNDNNWFQVSRTPSQTRNSVLQATNSLVATDFGIVSNIGAPLPSSGSTMSATAAVTGTAGGTSGAPSVARNGTTPVINGVNVTLPTSPNGMFVVSTNPNSRYLVETNPIFIGEQNPFLGSDYLAKLLGLDPDKVLQRLGDANYENRLIREQLVRQTGASLLRSVSSAFDQEKFLLDNANMEAKALRLNYGVALTADQVAALKHDIVWMVEQEVKGKRVLVPVVYLSTVTRATLEAGATIQATNVVVTGDSFLNRGGTVSGSGNLAIVTRGDIVNTSGTLMGGKVQLQSKDGSIINRTETFREGDAANYTTVAGKMGGIFASDSLFAKAGKDISIEGGAVDSGGSVTLLAGNKLNVTSLVLESRKRVFADTSGQFNRDVSDVTTTNQTALTASVTAKGDVTLAARQDVNLTGALVGSTDGQTTLISEKGNVNIGTLALTNSRRENTEHVGFFAESNVGKKEDTTGTPKAGTNVTVSAAQGRINALTNANKPDAKQPDPETTSAGTFAGLAIETKSNTESSTTNMGSLITGKGVAIVAKEGDVNITGSTIDAGKDGGYIEAGRDVNVRAAYDTANSTRNENSTRVGVAAEANADGAFTGLKVSGSSLQGTESSRTASVSQLNSAGSMTIIAGNKLTNEGTSIDAAQDVNIKAASVENLAARNEFNSTVKSTSYEGGLMVGVTTNGMGQSVANLAQGTGKELVIAAPESQVRLSGKGQTSETVTSTNNAVVTQIKAGGDVNMLVTGRVFDEGTSYSAGRDVNIIAGSYENAQATNYTNSSSNYTASSGSLTVGVDATRSANANLNVEGSSGRTTDNSSTAVVGSLNAGRSVNIRTTGDTTFQGTALQAGKDVNIDAGGNLNLLQANSTVNKTSNTQQGSANLSASLCIDLSCASGGAGASGRTLESTENSRIGVAGSLQAGGNINLRAGGDMTLQGTDITARGNTSLDAGRNIDFQALSSTVNKSSSADGGGANLNLNVGASGKIASDGGGGGSVNFERGRTTMEGEVRQGGTISTGGTFSVRSGGDTRLEGTQVQAGSAQLNVGGNFTMESAQSTVKQESSNVTGSVSLSAGKSGDGGRNFGGSAGFSSATDNKDNLTNQNATLGTTGSTILNVGGNATLAGANINAGGGVGGRIEGNLTVESRADIVKEDKTNITAYVGVGNMQLSGSGGGGSTSRAQRVDNAQDKFSNVANQAAGTGVFINAQSQTKDNVVITQQSGISGGGLGGGLQVGGNANLIGATSGTASNLNVQGTITSRDVQTRTSETNVDFAIRGTVASAAGSDQGSGGQFNNVFQASGGSRKPNDGGFTPGVTPEGPRRPAAQGGIEIGSQRRPSGADVGGVTTRVGALAGVTGAPVRPNAPSTDLPGRRPLTGSEAPARPDVVAGLSPRPSGADAPTPRRPAADAAPGWTGARPSSEQRPAPAARPTLDGQRAPDGYVTLPGTTPQAPATGGTAPRPAAAPDPATRPSLDGQRAADGYVAVPGATPQAPATAGTAPRPDAAPDPAARPTLDAQRATDGYVALPGTAPQAPATAGTPRTAPASGDQIRARLAEQGATQVRVLGGDAAGERTVLRNDANGLKLISLGKDYVGEESGSSAAHGLHADWKDAGAVRYLSPQDRAQREVYVGTDGRLLRRADNQPFDTGANKDGAIFVVDAQGRIYASTEQEVGKFHHSSFTGGEPIASAGHIVVQDGKILHLNNNSGHYRPDGEMLDQAVKAFKVDPADPSVRVVEIGGNGAIDRATGVVLNASTTRDLVGPDSARAVNRLVEQRTRPDGSTELFNPVTNVKVAVLDKHYQGEDKGNSKAHRDSAQFQGKKVDYLSATERNNRELVKGPDGKLYHKETGTLFSTGDKPDGAIFVIDATGRIFASTENEAGRFHHSSLAGGEPVSGAGHMVVRDGQILHVNNFSGHYKPDVEMLDRSLQFLGVQGDPNVRVVEQRADGQPYDRATGQRAPGNTFTAIIQVDALRAARMGTGMPQLQVETVRNGAGAIYRDPATGRKLAGIADAYKGEDKALAQANRNDHKDWAAKGGVIYLDDAGRAARELNVGADGRVTYKQSGKPFSTGDKADGAIFVVDAQGRIFASAENDPGQFHHSSFTGGNPVASAGHIVVKDGQLLHINNLSGHYRPDADMLDQGLAAFRVPKGDPNVRVIEIGADYVVDRATGQRPPGADIADLMRPEALRAVQASTGAPLRYEGEAEGGRQVYTNPQTGLVVKGIAKNYKNEENGTSVGNREHPDWRGEDASGAPKDGKVQYFRGAERAANELIISGGRLVHAATKKPYDTGDKPMGAIFVIDPSGRIYATDRQEGGKVHHSSLTAGDPVAMAGHLVVRDGQLIHINNMSGHYRPDGTMLDAGLNFLQQKGLDLRQARVVEVQPGPNGSQFIDRQAGTEIRTLDEFMQPDVDRALSAPPAPQAPAAGQGVPPAGRSSAVPMPARVAANDARWLQRA